MGLNSGMETIWRPISFLDARNIRASEEASRVRAFESPNFSRRILTKSLTQLWRSRLGTSLAYLVTNARRNCKTIMGRSPWWSEWVIPFSVESASRDCMWIRIFYHMQNKDIYMHDGKKSLKEISTTVAWLSISDWPTQLELPILIQRVGKSSPEIQKTIQQEFMREI